MTLYIPVGPPGCGKSTLANKMVEAGIITRTAIVNPDTYREILTDDINCQTENYEVFKICHQITRARLTKRLDVYFDATNVTDKAIASLVRLTPIEIKIILLVTSLSEEEIRRRNATRDRVVPENVMDRMFKRFHSYDPTQVWNMSFMTIETMLELCEERKQDAVNDNGES